MQIRAPHSLHYLQCGDRVGPSQTLGETLRFFA